MSTLSLSRSVELPAFMPVATYGPMRGVQLSEVESDLILSNTYHCRKLGRLKEFTGWRKCLLTDSGGFQIGSLRGAEVVEEGVIFPGGDGGPKRRAALFTPEESIRVQNKLGADIIMQLDEVVPPDSKRVEEAMLRSLRWLERCKKAHRTAQLLFPIVQGGLDLGLRSTSIEEILKKAPPGIAIGGLCGGEEKLEFCRVVHYCTGRVAELCGSAEHPFVPRIPVYVMGVGYPEDVVVCVALGCDMMDCVYPTRTARFGKILTDHGDINLNKAGDLEMLQRAPGEGGARVDRGLVFNVCRCSTCTRYSLQYLRSIRKTTNFCTLATAHNLHYMSELGKRMRDALRSGVFPEFVSGYMKRRFPAVPTWVVEALSWVGIDV